MAYIVHFEGWYTVMEETERGAESILRQEIEPAYESLIREATIDILDIVEVA